MERSLEVWFNLRFELVDEFNLLLRVNELCASCSFRELSKLFFACLSLTAALYSARYPSTIADTEQNCKARSRQA